MKNGRGSQNKATARLELNQLLEAYLAQGKKIKVLPTCPDYDLLKKKLSGIEERKTKPSKIHLVKDSNNGA